MSQDKIILDFTLTHDLVTTNYQFLKYLHNLDIKYKNTPERFQMGNTSNAIIISVHDLNLLRVQNDYTYLLATVEWQKYNLTVYHAMKHEYAG